MPHKVVLFVRFLAHHVVVACTLAMLAALPALERRRNANGLFELRAKREGAVSDRRRGDRRDERGGRVWYAFWRRQ